MTSGLRIALYQPDIAGNTGTILRMAACLGIAVDIIEPAGFDLSDRALKRAGMDYLEMAALTRHVDFARFEDWRRGEGRRLVLFSTKAALPYTEFAFAETRHPAVRPRIGRRAGPCPRRRRRTTADPDAGRRPQPQRRARRGDGAGEARQLARKLVDAERRHECATVASL